MSVARVVGHVSWWLFVVARLMSEPGWTMGGMPRRYADYSDESIFGSGLGSADYGWTAYEPLTNRTPSAFADPFFTANVIENPLVMVGFSAYGDGSRRASDDARLTGGGNTDHAGHFRLSILRVFGPSTSPSDVDDAESHYKRALMTREFGLNRN